MKKLLLSFGLVAMIGLTAVCAQSSEKSTDSTLQISGSADIYYKYDVAHSSKFLTSVYSLTDEMGNKFNTLDFGMLDLKLKKTIGKATINSELVFGPRGESKIDNGILAYYVQNLYLGYNVNNKLSFYTGVMYHYNSYEKLTAADNFNYAMSGSFLEQRKVPARSVGVKAAYKFSDKVKLEAGLYNSVNPLYNNSNQTLSAVNATPSFGLSDFAAQLTVLPVKDLELSAAIWAEGQKDNGTHTNFQAKYNAGKGWKLGLDVTDYSCKDSIVVAAGNAFSSFTSYALYIQKKVCSGYTVGLRYENMNRNDLPVSANQYISSSSAPLYSSFADNATFTKSNYSMFTLTSAIKLGDLTLKQELKYDQINKLNKTPYIDKDGNITDHSVQIYLAAVYTF